MLESLLDIGPLLLAILGFGALIFVHELGHFLAARWAGVRVHEFALGFGTAVCSWRQGIGFRWRSTTREYLRMLEARGEGGDPSKPETRTLPGVSPTEYRLNWFPFGGYVKMLGQDDLDPSATSSLTESYNSKPIWKRMVIVSAGIAMNVVVAALLFVVVFMAGLPAAAPVVGAASAPPADAAQDAPAQTGDGAAEEAAPALPGMEARAQDQRLKPGDRILRVGGSRIRSFNDVIVAVAMAPKDESLELLVERPGQREPVAFEMTPWKDEATQLLSVGAAPALSATIAAPASDADAQLMQRLLEQAGLAGVAPGSRIVDLAGEPVGGFWDVQRLIAASGGEPLPVIVETPTGDRLERQLAPEPELHIATVEVPGADLPVAAAHLLGFTPAVRVAAVAERAQRFGLQSGDVVAGADGVSWPDAATLVQRIRAKAGKPISLILLRDGQTRDIEAIVATDGTIGFNLGDTQRQSARITTPPPDSPRRAALLDEAGEPFPAARLALSPGSIIESVGGLPVADFAQLRDALRDATRAARQADEGAQVELTARLPIASAAEARVDATLVLSADDVRSLHALGWISPLSASVFEPMMTTLSARHPGEALAMGVLETRRVILMTYLTLLRLAQGSVQVEHLKGPVGIAEIGTRVARSGTVQLLFFLAVISANLAVINFLPLPIVDGGLFLMLVYEWIRGRPLPVAAQNALTLAGLMLIGAVFLIVTFNDIRALLG